MTRTVLLHRVRLHRLAAEPRPVGRLVNVDPGTVGGVGQSLPWGGRGYHLPIAFIFVGDRWNKWNLSDSGYVWLPLSFDEESSHPIMTWHDEWSPAAWPS
jgi:hypothetical protein